MSNACENMPTTVIGAKEGGRIMSVFLDLPNSGYSWSRTSMLKNAGKYTCELTKYTA